MAILSIRRQVNSGVRSEQIDVAQLLTHFLAFGLYLCSSLVLLYFYLTYYAFHSASDEAFSIAFDVSNVLSFSSQLFLCCILWKLSSKRHRRPVDESIVVETQYDEDEDLQARIWKQFIRRGDYQLKLPDYTSTIQQRSDHVLSTVSQDQPY